MNTRPRHLRTFNFRIRCTCGLEDGVTVKDFDPKMPGRWQMECYECGNALVGVYSQTTGVVVMSVEGGAPQEVARVPRTWL